MKSLIYLLAFLLAGFAVYSQNLDIDILRNINLNRNKSLDPMFRFITNSATPVSIAVPVIIYGTGLIKRDSSLKKKALFIGETFLAATLISTALKYSINRTRPFYTYTYLEKETVGGGPSFPSGHTSVAFATATSLSMAFPKWYVIAPSYVWASAVAYSRLDLGVHYPSDVLAGAVVGAGSAWLCRYLNNRLFKHKHTHSL